MNSNCLNNVLDIDVIASVLLMLMVIVQYHQKFTPTVFSVCLCSRSSVSLSLSLHLALRSIDDVMSKNDVTYQSSFFLK